MNDEDLKKEVIDFDLELNSISSNQILSVISSVTGYTLEDIDRYIKSPMRYNSQVRQICREFYNTNGLLSNVIDYMVAMPKLSSMTTIRNFRNITEYGLKKRQKVEDLSYKIGHKGCTRDGIRGSLNDGMYVAILRDSNDSVKPLSSGFNVDSIEEIDALNISDSVMLQPLNIDYCKIIGLNGATQIAAFDMMYFDQFKYGGLLHEIKNYPKSFLKGYNDYKKDNNKRWFILDPYTTVVKKFKAGKREPYGRPYALSALRDLKFSKDYEDDMDKTVRELASTIYYLIYPEGETKGKAAINKEQQTALKTAFENSVLSNVNSSGKKTTTLTLPPNTKIDRMTKDPSLIKDTLSEENMKKVSTSLGFASSALNASSEGGASYASLQVNIDLISGQIFEMLEDFSEEYTRVFNYYLFGEKNPSIIFEYLNITQLNSKETFEQAKQLYGTAGGSRRYLIEASKYNSESYLSMMAQEKYEDLDNMFPPHATSYTMSDSADKNNPDGNYGGRPQKDLSDINNPSSLNYKSENGNEVV